jgi:hypothetical protein
MISRTWYYVQGPWDKYIGNKFGEYTLLDYRDAPSIDYVNIPPLYIFVLSDSDGSTLNHIDFNILRLEQWANK